MIVRRLMAPHYCYDWNGLYVKPSDPGAECCICKFTLRTWAVCWWHYFWRGEEDKK